jgi:hypothetical protein
LAGCAGGRTRGQMRELRDSKSKLGELARTGGCASPDEIVNCSRVVLEVVDSERERHSLARTEGVDEEWKGRTTRVLEKERRTACFRCPVGDGSDLEQRVGSTPDTHKLATLFERTNERAHSVPRHGKSALRAIFDDAF